MRMSKYDAVDYDNITYLFIFFCRFGPPIWTVLIWVSLFALWLNVAPHISHVFGFKPKWTPLTCSSNFSFDMNPFGHVEHLHGFLLSGVWRLKIWNCRFFFDEHTWNIILSSIKISLQVRKKELLDLYSYKNCTFPHSSHWHSSWARLKCLGRAEGCLKSFPHFGHGTCCFPCSVIMCNFNARGLNFFPHSLQTSILSSPLCSRSLHKWKIKTNLLNGLVNF